jgi:hypothetical protein
VSGVGADTLAVQRLEELLEQKRIAARRRMTCVREDIIGALSESLADEIPDGVFAQWGGMQGGSQRVAGDLRDLRRVLARLSGPSAAHHQHRQTLEAAYQVREEAQRGAVAPVQIVDRQEEWNILAEVDGQPVEAVQGRKGGILNRLVAGSGRES